MNERSPDADKIREQLVQYLSEREPDSADKDQLDPDIILELTLNSGLRASEISDLDTTDVIYQ
jgi:site-specific recombinase XerD